ncbi:hypothetical protein C0585_04060 [Candidatus Woesearchaeota archaeon]|nr:MAG: hypothetical protein C0585_04060 [Candidatus Woesearchaeota archaeon]
MKEVLEITDIGKRKENQDNKIVDSKNGIYLLADGMGGEKAGGLCSLVTNQIMYKHLLELKDSLNSNRLRKELIQQRIENKLKETNDIVSYAGKSETVLKWGTTIDCCFLHEDKAYIAHSGDSIIYHINLLYSGSLKKLTKPHVSNDFGLYNMAKKEREIILSFEPLTNYVGCGDGFYTDFLSMDFNESDILLMATDGLSKTVTEFEIKKMIMKNEDPKGNENFENNLAKDLLELSKNPKEMVGLYESASKKGYNIDISRGIGDNTTMIIIYGGK